MLDWLRGLHTPPWLVGLTRGAAEAVALVLLAELGAWLAGANVPNGLRLWAPVLVLALRELEALADQLDPEKRRRA